MEHLFSFAKIKGQCKQQKCMIMNVNPTHSLLIRLRCLDPAKPQITISMYNFYLITESKIKRKIGDRHLPILGAHATAYTGSPVFSDKANSATGSHL